MTKRVTLTLTLTLTYSPTDLLGVYCIKSYEYSNVRSVNTRWNIFVVVVMCYLTYPRTTHSASHHTAALWGHSVSSTMYEQSSKLNNTENIQALGMHRLNINDISIQDSDKET